MTDFTDSVCFEEWECRGIGDGVGAGIWIKIKIRSKSRIGSIDGTGESVKSVSASLAPSRFGVSPPNPESEIRNHEFPRTSTR